MRTPGIGPALGPAKGLTKSQSSPSLLIRRQRGEKFMFELMKLVHFLGLIAGIGGGAANLLAGRVMAGQAPENRAGLAAFRPLLAKTSTYGLVLLWLSGITLLNMTMVVALFENPVFIWKMVAVVVLTLISVTANLTMIRARKSGNPPDAQLMKKLGIWGQVFAILALILAVIAFN